MLGFSEKNRGLNADKLIIQKIILQQGYICYSHEKQIKQKTSSLENIA